MNEGENVINDLNSILILDSLNEVRLRLGTVIKIAYNYGNELGDYTLGVFQCRELFGNEIRIQFIISFRRGFLNGGG